MARIEFTAVFDSHEWVVGFPNVAHKEVHGMCGGGQDPTVTASSDSSLKLRKK